jgi:hypothetical protein
MALIYTHIPKRKARKPTAKQRELQESWEKLLKKYETKKVIKADVKLLIIQASIVAFTSALRKNLKFIRALQ